MIPAKALSIAFSTYGYFISATILFILDPLENAKTYSNLTI